LAPSTTDMGSKGLAPERLNLMARGLPSNMIMTVQSMRAPRVVDNLMFLQELFEQGLSVSTLKVYMAANCHVGINGSTRVLILWRCNS
jgi:hypothetical protein